MGVKMVFTGIVGAIKFKTYQSVLLQVFSSLRLCRLRCI